MIDQKRADEILENISSPIPTLIVLSTMIVLVPMLIIWGLLALVQL